MRLSVCFAFLLLGTALAGPAAKVTERKSLNQDAISETKKTDLTIEETGEDKERSKKSATTFCVQIQPGSSQATQVPCKNSQAAVQTLPYTIQTQTLPQQIQTLNVVQQPVPQANIVVPQQVIQPFQTGQIAQPLQQPFAQSVPNANIIQTVPQTSVIQTTAKPKPTPEPTPSPIVNIKTEEPIPERMEVEPLPEPQEMLTILPIAPPSHEHLIAVPSSPVMLVPEPEHAQVATMVEFPSVSPCHNPLHNVLSPCTCQTSNVAMLGDSNLESMAMNVIPLVAPYSAARSSGLITPYSRALPQIMGNMETRMGSQGRTTNLLKLNSSPQYRTHAKGQHKIYQKLYAPETGTNSMAGRGLTNVGCPQLSPSAFTVNTFACPYRAASPTYRIPQNSLNNEENAVNSPVTSEVSDLMQTNKVPRNVKSDQLVEKKEDSIKQQGDRASNEDSLHSSRSNKEEVKVEKRRSD